MVDDCGTVGVHNNNAGEKDHQLDASEWGELECKSHAVISQMDLGPEGSTSLEATHRHPNPRPLLAVEIFDRYILRVAPDLEWHAACLKCVQCNRYLDESCTAFVRDGKTYCKLDYVRLFAIKCAKCHENFGKNDFVMRAKHCVFHVDCFRCGYCDHRLVPGEEFALKDDQLFCKNDCEQHHHDTKPVSSCDQSSEPFGRRTTGRAAEDELWNIAGPAGLTQLEPALSLAGLPLPQRLATTPPMSTTSPNSDEVVTTMVPAASTSSSSSSSSKKHKKDKAKTTRMRTVLTEKQLMTLRACYAANCRPDALMKEQLVEMTSLTARVIRVWFQNKRCKDKKRQIAMKQMQAAQEKGIGPLIAGSPSTHDPVPLGQALDVQHYSQNPSLWGGGMSMDGCMDHQTPPFQQLMHGFGDNGPLGHGGGTDLGGFLVPASSYAPPPSLGSSAGVDLDSFSPQMNVSDLSSPSCSE